MSYEDMEVLVTSMKDKLDETESAKVSEDLLGIMSNYKGLEDALHEREEEVSKLKADKDELLAVNGRLFQKIGFDKVESPVIVPEQAKREEVQLTDIINEKGELI